jgi:hypothetical protein
MPFEASLRGFWSGDLSLAPKVSVAGRAGYGLDGVATVFGQIEGEAGFTARLLPLFPLNGRLTQVSLGLEGSVGIKIWISKGEVLNLQGISK